MKPAATWLCILSLNAIGAVSAAAPEEPALKTLRGHVALTEERAPGALKPWQRDRDPIPRDYVQQPPLIPHHIKGYVIDKNNNKCMTCHSWARYKEFGATKISVTHFRDRAGTELADVSPRRYFCTQCHVPQTDDRPLVKNLFKPIQAVRQPSP